MGKTNTEKNNIAMLIDCDNVSYKYIDGIVNDLSKYGVVNIKNAYGNWKDPKLKGWEDSLQEYAIKPIQQFSYTQGKNASDIAMVIDVMDLLYTKELSAIALITSDSDFTPVVSRILSNGLTVYGYGEKKTPSPFVNSCSQFIYAEKLITIDEYDTKNFIYTKNELRGDKKLIFNINKAIEITSDDDGWANIASVGIYLSQKSSFSPINYGYQKLGHLIKATELYQVKKAGEHKNILLIRSKRNSY